MILHELRIRSLTNQYFMECLNNISDFEHSSKKVKKYIFVLRSGQLQFAYSVRIAMFQSSLKTSFANVVCRSGVGPILSASQSWEPETKCTELSRS